MSCPSLKLSRFRVETLRSNFSALHLKVNFSYQLQPPKKNGFPLRFPKFTPLVRQNFKRHRTTVSQHQCVKMNNCTEDFEFNGAHLWCKLHATIKSTFLLPLKMPITEIKCQLMACIHLKWVQCNGRMEIDLIFRRTCQSHENYRESSSATSLNVHPPIQICEE